MYTNIAARMQPFCKSRPVTPQQMQSLEVELEDVDDDVDDVEPLEVLLPHEQLESLGGEEEGAKERDGGGGGAKFMSG